MSTITISSHDITNWSYGGASATLRIFPTDTFRTSDGDTVLVGNVSRNEFYKSVSCTVSGTTVTIPQFTIDSTIDGTPTTARYNCWLYDSNGVKRSLFHADIAVPLTTPTTWTNLVLYSRRFPRRPDNDVYTKDEIETRLDNLSASSITDFSEATQDAVGAMIDDSDTIDVEYDDTTGTATLEVIGLRDETAFNTAIPFSANFTKMADHTMVADVTFTVNATNEVGGAVTSLRITGNGTHTVDFTGIKRASGSGTFVTTNGVLNVLLFFFDKSDYWVNIFQEADATIPVLSTATVEDANPDQIVLTYNEDLDEASVPDVGDFSPSGGRTVTLVEVNGAVVTLTVDTPYSSADTITLDYTAGAEPIQDEAGNNAANLNDEDVENNINVSEIDIVPDLSSSGVTFDHMDEDPVGTWKAIDAVAAWNHFAQCLQKLPASTDGYVDIEPVVGTSGIGFMDADDFGNYTVWDWGGFISGGTFWSITAASPNDEGTGYVAGDKIRLKRTAGTITLVRVRAAAETVVKTFGGTHNGDLFVGFAITNENDTFIEPRGYGVTDK